MTKGAHRRYAGVKCPRCGREVGATVLARHLKKWCKG